MWWRWDVSDSLTGWVTESHGIKVRSQDEMKRWPDNATLLMRLMTTTKLEQYPSQKNFRKYDWRQNTFMLPVFVSKDTKGRLMFTSWKKDLRRHGWTKKKTPIQIYRSVCLLKNEKMQKMVKKKKDRKNAKNGRHERTNEQKWMDASGGAAAGAAAYPEPPLTSDHVAHYIQTVVCCAVMWVVPSFPTRVRTSQHSTEESKNEWHRTWTLRQLVFFVLRPIERARATRHFSNAVCEIRSLEPRTTTQATWLRNHSSQSCRKREISPRPSSFFRNHVLGERMSRGLW